MINTTARIGGVRLTGARAAIDEGRWSIDEADWSDGEGRVGGEAINAAVPKKAR